MSFSPAKFVCYLAPTSPQFMDIYLSSFWTFLWPNWHKSGPNFCTFGAKKIIKRFFPTFRPASYVSCKMTHCKIPYQNTKESFLDNFCRRRATPHFGPQPSQLSIFFGAFALQNDSKFDTILSDLWGKDSRPEIVPLCWWALVLVGPSHVSCKSAPAKKCWFFWFWDIVPDMVSYKKS